jgi:arabinose-5-phosphate isomerase
MIADDIPDLAVLFERVGLKIAVANATLPVTRSPDWQSTTARRAGRRPGVLRRAPRCRGQLDAVVERYVAERRARRDDRGRLPGRGGPPGPRGEAAAVGGARPTSGRGVRRGLRLVADAKGRVVLSGIGKSGHIARKLAGTLTSTGTPATFMHAVEALHGDLGIVGRGDVAILVSKSGRGSEIGGLVGYLGGSARPVIALTGDADSDLARNADVVLDCSVDAEACPMNLTPTSSTTATLAMGDALAMVVLQLKGFASGDFAALHPGGALGLKLTVRVADVMIGDGFPSLPQGSTMREAIAPLAEKRGTVPIVDDERRVVGIVTTGDLTRLMEHDEGSWNGRSTRS